MYFRFCLRCRIVTLWAFVREATKPNTAKGQRWDTYQCSNCEVLRSMIPEEKSPVRGGRTGLSTGKVLVK